MTIGGEQVPRRRILGRVREQTHRVLRRRRSRCGASRCRRHAAARRCRAAADRMGRRRCAGCASASAARSVAAKRAAAMRRCFARATSPRAPSRRSTRCHARLHRALKAAFDPAGILNPGPLVCGALGLGSFFFCVSDRRARLRSERALRDSARAGCAYSWIDSTGSPASPALAAASSSRRCLARSPLAVCGG